MNRLNQKITYSVALLIFFSVLTFSCYPAITFAQETDSTKAMIQNARLGRGVNLGNALEAPDIGEWGVVLKEEYFELIAEQGFNSVRVPIRWNAHAAYANPYQIHTSFFETVDWVIENSFKNGLYVIINFHHYEALYDNPDAEKQRFLALWEQICQRYADYPDSLYFEILNEPHGNLTASKWNSLLAEAYTTIRNLQPNRTLIIGVAEYGGIGGLNKLELPAEDDNIILTVHYYNPFHFTHQGAGWVSGSDDWLGTSWNNTEKERQTIVNEMKAVVDFSEEHNIPVYMGEFGAYSQADEQSRVRWTNYIARYFENLGFSWAYWEFCSGFGIYNDNNKKWNEGLLYALQKMPMANPNDKQGKIELKNLVTNGDFSDSAHHWYLYTGQNRKATFTVNEQEGQISILSEPGASNEISLINSGLQLEKNQTYRVSFEAYADTESPVQVSIMNGFNPWEWVPYSEMESFQISTEKKSFGFYFSMNANTDHNARFRLDVGNNKTNIYVDNIAVEDVSITNDTTKSKVSFIIKDEESNQVLPDCNVTFTGQTVTTSPEGLAEFYDVPVGYHEVTVLKQHYEQTDKKKVAIYKDTTRVIHVAKKMYNDTIKIIDSNTLQPLSGVSVQLGSFVGTTNFDGEIVFQISHGSYMVTAKKTGYETQVAEDHMVPADTPFLFRLLKTHASAQFKISNNSRPINNVKVIGESDTLWSNNLGIVNFSEILLNTNFSYTLSKPGYDNASGSFTISNDTTIYIDLVKNLVDIKFNVFSDEAPVVNAMVIFMEDTAYTNNQGFTGFYNYPINQPYNYVIRASGYELNLESFYVDSDTTVQVTLITSDIKEKEVVVAQIYPNPVSDYIQIHSIRPIASLQIVNILGKKQFEKNASTLFLKQDVSFLNNGYYLLKIKLDNDSELILPFLKTE